MEHPQCRLDSIVASLFDPVGYNIMQISRYFRRCYTHKQAAPSPPPLAAPSSEPVPVLSARFRSGYFFFWFVARHRATTLSNEREVSVVSYRRLPHATCASSSNLRDIWRVDSPLADYDTCPTCFGQLKRCRVIVYEACYSSFYIHKTMLPPPTVIWLPVKINLEINERRLGKERATISS